MIKKIKSLPAEKVLFLGIGNTARGDDGAGPYFINSLGSVSQRHKYKFIDCGVMPESFVKEIKACKPALIVFVDAADYGGEKAEIRELSLSEIDGVSASTHSMPLTLLAKFLAAEIQPAPDFLFLGVQAASVNIGDDLDNDIIHSINNLVAALVI
ncbi:MAG: hydrogenase maturation protease [Elusimicrobium sp.]|jgi:hydrogenase 3 maturation protease|nr:hydrogenase maturation protease [Elusimicrobium sp.]